MFLKGLRADAQDEVADLKLGLAKQIVLGLADQMAGQLGNLLFDGAANLRFQQFRFPFLFLAEIMPDHGVSFRANYRDTRKLGARVQKFYQLFSCSHDLLSFARILLDRRRFLDHDHGSSMLPLIGLVLATVSVGCAIRSKR
jgi:hypothetical protein